MQINWWTFGLQALNFLVLCWLLWRFLYRPVKEVIEKRKELTEHAFAEADKRQAELETAQRGLEEERAAMAQERQDMLKKVHAELEAERSKLLEEAKREAEGLLKTARESIGDEREAALRELRAQVNALAVELASGLLREAGSSASADVFLEKLEGQLENMPTDERERLRKDLEPEGARLTVVTAVPLTAEEEEAWRDRLGRSLGRKDKTDFVTDAGILGGAELRSPHVALKFTWADQLNKARELLGKDEASSR